MPTTGGPRVRGHPGISACPSCSSLPAVCGYSTCTWLGCRSLESSQEDDYLHGSEEAAGARLFCLSARLLTHWFGLRRFRHWYVAGTLSGMNSVRIPPRKSSHNTSIFFLFLLRWCTAHTSVAHCSEALRDSALTPTDIKTGDSFIHRRQLLSVCPVPRTSRC